MALTAKQEMFVKEYLIDLNATRAAIRAGYSENTAQTIGAENLTKPIISDAIQKAMNERANKLDISAEKTLKKLMRGQEFDIRNLYHENGCIKLPHELDDDTAAAVVGVKYKDGIFEEYKIIDVKGCTELVGKHLILFTDKSQSDVAVTTRELPPVDPNEFV